MQQRSKHEYEFTMVKRRHEPYQRLYDRMALGFHHGAAISRNNNKIAAISPWRSASSGTGRFDSTTGAFSQYEASTLSAFTMAYGASIHRYSTIEARKHRSMETTTLSPWRFGTTHHGKAPCARTTTTRKQSNVFFTEAHGASERFRTAARAVSML